MLGQNLTSDKALKQWHETRWNKSNTQIGWCRQQHGHSTLNPKNPYWNSHLPTIRVVCDKALSKSWCNVKVCSCLQANTTSIQVTWTKCILQFIRNHSLLLKPKHHLWQTYRCFLEQLLKSKLTYISLLIPECKSCILCPHRAFPLDQLLQTQIFHWEFLRSLHSQRTHAPLRDTSGRSSNPLRKKQTKIFFQKLKVQDSK